jgi:hypothetical protein
MLTVLARGRELRSARGETGLIGGFGGIRGRSPGIRRHQVTAVDPAEQRQAGQHHDDRGEPRGPDRPKPRTTDDDLREREEEIEAARAKLLEERAREESGEG